MLNNTFSFCIFLSLTSLILSSYTPVIGIYDNPYPWQDLENKTSQLSGSYVRWLIASGAEVIAIHPWYTVIEGNTILSKVNGVLFQGGSRDFKVNEEWEQKALYIIQKSIDYQFPVWGTCQGFQLILTLLSKHQELGLDSYDDNSFGHPLIFTDATNESRMYSLFSENQLNMLKDSDSTIYFHHFGVNTSDFYKYELNKKFDITSLGVDHNNKVFINSIEAKSEKISIYAVQYHPEKNPYIRDKAYLLEQNMDSIVVSQGLGFFLVSEARKSSARFNDDDRNIYDFISTGYPGKEVKYDNEENVYYYEKQ